MRILAITNHYPTPGQPMFAAYNRQQFAQLARFHELRIIRPVPWPIVAWQMLRDGRQPFAETNEDGIKVHYPTFYYPPRILRVHHGVFYKRSIAAIVRKTLTDYQPDVILGSWAHPDGWAAARLGHEAGIPVVTKVLGSDVLVLAQGQRRAGVAAALRAADGVVAVSKDLARHAMRLGVASNRVHVVHEGLDGNRFAPGDARLARARLGLTQDLKLLLFVGNLLVSKGTADLVNACALLRGRGVAFCCRLVGEGRDADTISELVRAHRLDDLVVLTGARPHAELPDWYRASDVVALPSYSEGIPNVLREAIACGKPFVATKVGGIPEIAHPSFSRLVSAGSVRELADTLQAMLDAPSHVEQDLVRRINITWEESARLLAVQLQAAVDARRDGAGQCGTPRVVGSDAA